MIAVESVVSFWAVKMKAKRLNTLWYSNVMLRIFLYLISTFFLFRLVVLLSFLICSQRMRKKMKNLLKKTVLRKQLPLYDGFKHLMYSCMRYHISPCPALNSGVVDNASVLRLRLFSSVLRRKKLGLTKLCSLKFGAGHRQLKIFTRKMLFLSLKWRRTFSRFKLHATCICTSLMAAILWNTNSTGKDTRQCSYEWEMMHQKQRTTIKYYYRAGLLHSTPTFVVAVFS